ncbi:CLUMA_CG016851, isoform A [Clunio marinus]|uniref:CLUMA_CG016851, isoform A n=1 Tax=Clunio marinus TaxID=568069 RepID=A0A1J1IX52_9DIPT|nr:CLUMA_CG016851, isoform A [Clunio marinus]
MIYIMLLRGKEENTASQAIKLIPPRVKRHEILMRCKVTMSENILGTKIAKTKWFRLGLPTPTSSSCCVLLHETEPAFHHFRGSTTITIKKTPTVLDREMKKLCRTFP